MPRILVVDDELLILSAVERALLKVGYQVFCACNAGELEKVLAEGPFDLLITDVHLADETVENVIRQVTGGSPSVRVIMMSGLPGRAGVQNFIEKPFSIEGLRKKVKDVLDQVQ